MVGGGHGPQGNQPKIIFRNHSRPLDSIGQALTSSSMFSERPAVLSINFYKLLKTIYLQISTCLPCLPACLMCWVKHCGKVATATTLLLWWKCLEFHDEKPYAILNAYTCKHCSLTVLALIFLYGGHCLSVQLSSKVTLRFSTSRQASRTCNDMLTTNNNISWYYSDCLMAFAGVL